MPTPEQPPEVLGRFCHGDLDAFEALFRGYQNEVYRWIVRIVCDPAAAEDLTVETFWRIYRAHARFDPRRAFGPWARRIATNAALDCLKRARPETEVRDDLMAPPTANPGISEELRRKIALAFRRLSPGLQAAATLALIEEQPYKEIAEALGISTVAVKVRVFRAVRLLRKELRGLEIEP
jgi:RNA polymerase sigma factor (sigma-70 family)